MKLKSTYYICEVKCLIYIYRNCASEFDCGHGPLTGFVVADSSAAKGMSSHAVDLSVCVKSFFLL